jgi:isoamyl acetate esterase
MGRPKVLLLGDSLTQTAFEGWAAALADIYQRRADVLNRGMSGYNTRWYLKYSNDHGIWHETQDEVMLITLFFGANDASLAAENPHAHVPLGEYSANLSQLIKLCRISYPKAKIICITPPPVHHGQRLAYQLERFGVEKATGVLERTLETTGNYAKACVIVSEQYRVPHLDLYHAMLVVPPKTTTTTTAMENGGTIGDSPSKDDPNVVVDHGRYFTDGLHFSKEGHDFVVQAILQLIEKELPELHVGKDPVTGQWNNSGTTCTGIVSSGPYHDQIDHTCFEKAFSKQAGEIVQPMEEAITITTTTNADADTAPEDAEENNDDGDDEDIEDEEGEADDFEEDEDGIDDMAAAAAIVAAETADDDDDDDNYVKADTEHQDDDKEEQINDDDNDSNNTDEDLQPESNGDDDKKDDDLVDEVDASDNVDADGSDEPDPKRPRMKESAEE